MLGSVSNANKSWLAEATRRPKKVSFKSKQAVSSRSRLKRGLGLLGWKVTVAALTEILHWAEVSSHFP